MQNAMRERQMSMQLAGAREMFNWLASFYGIATLAMLAGYVCNSFAGVSHFAFHKHYSGRVINLWLSLFISLTTLNFSFTSNHSLVKKYSRPHCLSFVSISQLVVSFVDTYVRYRRLGIQVMAGN